MLSLSRCHLCSYSSYSSAFVIAPEETYAYSLAETRQILNLLPPCASTICAVGAFAGLRRGGIIASFLDDGEIDEFMIHVIPKFIGEAIPLIAPDRRNLPLKLIASMKFTDGVLKLHYSVHK